MAEPYAARTAAAAAWRHVVVSPPFRRRMSRITRERAVSRVLETRLNSVEKTSLSTAKPTRSQPQRSDRVLRNRRQWSPGWLALRRVSAAASRVSVRGPEVNIRSPDNDNVRYFVFVKIRFETKKNWLRFNFNFFSEFAWTFILSIVWRNKNYFRR